MTTLVLGADTTVVTLTNHSKLRYLIADAVRLVKMDNDGSAVLSEDSEE